MININKPTINDISIITNCASACTDDLLAQELIDAIPYFTQIYQDYDRLMTASTGYTIPRSLANGNLNADFMKNLYTKQLVGKTGRCRDDYDRILASAPRKKCPMCSESIVTALDHHVPKSSYFLYSVFPKNLVPICSRCNEAKKHTMPNQLNKQFIHPYYDDFSQAQWFEVRFTSMNPIELTYVCKNNLHLGNGADEKLKSHFRRLKLDELYSSNAIVRLEDLRNNFQPLLDLNDWDSVYQELIDQQNMFSRRPDSWEYALFSKLINERWYIEGGFANI